MTGSIYLLFIAVICIGLAVFYWILFLFEQAKAPKATKQKKKEGTFSFTRVNEVEGVLTVDGKKMKTYNIGELVLDETITIRFFQGINTEVRITDIYYEGKSLYVFAPAGNWRTKADYAISVLKQLVNEGKISLSLVGEVEEILLEVETQNKYIENGNLVLTDDEDFVWIF